MPQNSITLPTTPHGLLHNYLLIFSKTHLFSATTLNTPGLSLTKNLNWKLHISLPVRSSACSRFSVLYRLKHISPSQLLTIYKVLVFFCMVYLCNVCGGVFLHTADMNRANVKAFRLISFFSSYWVYLLKVDGMLLAFLSSTGNFMLTALRNLLYASTRHAASLHSPSYTWSPLLCLNPSRYS